MLVYVFCPLCTWNYVLNEFSFYIFKFLNNNRKVVSTIKRKSLPLKIWSDAPPSLNKWVYISYKQGHYPINHNKTIKIRKLTLMHYHHLIFRSCSIFTSHPNNVLYSKRIQFRITPCLFLITSFHSPSVRNSSSVFVWPSRPWNFLRLCRPVIL